VSHSGGVTRIAPVDDPSDAAELRMAKLQRGYYVVMSQEGADIEYLYWLMRVERRRATLYSTDQSCSRLQKLWLVDGKTPADVGIAAIEGRFVATCLFTRYEDLARAFRDLLADGGLEPAAVLERR
jgi:hypothetical protein